MTLAQMRDALQQGAVTSVQLVEEALEKAEEYKDKNAIGMLSPLALERAKKMDAERKAGRVRSPLHGIPIVIKDNLLYDDGTPTTANSYALHDLIPPYNADVVDQLLKAGVVILGKANLSEWAYFMSREKMPSGYGSMYGQVKHPFDESMDPLGSSTGSAVAVKLGIVPGSIGTETNGSIMAPAYVNQVVGFKPSFGNVFQAGIIPISPTQDIAGPLANTVEDCALIYDVISNQSSPIAPKLHQHLSKGKIGFLHINGHIDEVSEMTLGQAKERFSTLGHEVIDYYIDYKRSKNEQSLIMEFRPALDEFLSTVQGATAMTSMADVISFNQKNKKRCLKYGQSLLLDSQASTNGPDSKAFQELREELMQNASELETLMSDNNLLGLVAPTWLEHAPIYGNPSVCVPVGMFKDGPEGLIFIAKKGQDDLALRLAHLYQKNIE